MQTHAAASTPPPPCSSLPLQPSASPLPLAFASVTAPVKANSNKRNSNNTHHVCDMCLPTHPSLSKINCYIYCCGAAADPPPHSSSNHQSRRGQFNSYAAFMVDECKNLAGFVARLAANAALARANARGGRGRETVGGVGWGGVGWGGVGEVRGRQLIGELARDDCCCQPRPCARRCRWRCRHKGC
jgi:hypothetical protein